MNIRNISVAILLFLIVGEYGMAQEIKFPESFHSDALLFEGMKLAEIPTDVASKYGITKNPGLISDVAKAKGALSTAKMTGVKAIYLEVWKDPMIEKSDCGYEVAQFASIAELEKALPEFKSSFYRAILTAQNYLIVVKCVPSKIAEQKIDEMVAHFQQKLGAKLFLDRKKEVEVAVTENYVSNLPPPLPPRPENTVTKIAIGDLDKRIANSDGLAYMRTKKREKLAPGNYFASSTSPAFEVLEFTIDQDSLLHGNYLYHYAEDYSKSPSKESKLTYDHGVLTSEIMYANGQLLGSGTYSASVVKEGKDYLITLKSSMKNPSSGDKEVVTVFRNRKPISKITTRAGVSVIRKDFEKDYLDEFNSKGQLVKLEKPGLIEKYNNAGEVIYKEEWSAGNHVVYRNGKLRRKETRVKGKEQYLVTEYDDNGKVVKEWLEGKYEKHAEIADPDEYEDSLSKAMFEYYKRKTN